MKTRYSVRFPAALLFSVIGVGIVHDVAAQGCTLQDQQTITIYSQQIMEAMMQAMLNGNSQNINQITQQMQSKISPDCQEILSQQQKFPQGNSIYGDGSGGSVFDHGGGTYSVPGGAACGPSGCISLD